MSYGPAWSTTRVPGQSRQSHRETLSREEKKKQKHSVSYHNTGSSHWGQGEVLTRGTADRLLRQTSHRTVLLTLEHCHTAHNRTVSGDHRGGLEDFAQSLIHSPLSCLSADNFPHKARPWPEEEPAFVSAPLLCPSSHTAVRTPDTNNFGEKRFILAQAFRGLTPCGGGQVTAGKCTPCDQKAE